MVSFFFLLAFFLALPSFSYFATTTPATRYLTGFLCHFSASWLWLLTPEQGESKHFQHLFPRWTDGGSDIRIGFPSTAIASLVPATLAEYEGKRAYMYISHSFFCCCHALSGLGLSHQVGLVWGNGILAFVFRVESVDNQPGTQ
jgi:hypothetical protein